MRTRSLVPLLVLALPVFAGAEEPAEDEPADIGLFEPLDLRDDADEGKPSPEPTPAEVAAPTPPAAAAAPEATPAPAPVAAPEPTPAPAAEAAAATPAAQAPGAGAAPLGVEPEDAPAAPAFDEEPLAVGLKVDLLVPTSRVDSTGAIALELRYRLPFYQRRIGLAAEVGWYPLAGEGKSVDPQQGTFAFEWGLDSLPLHFGVEVLPPLPLRLPPLLERLRPYGEAGFAMAFLWSKATYRNADGETFIRDNLQKDTAIGWYVGAGALYRIGPGDLVGGYRHDALKTDMDIPFANEESGDVGGSHVQAGYRLAF